MNNSGYRSALQNFGEQRCVQTLEAACGAQQFPRAADYPTTKNKSCTIMTPDFFHSAACRASPVAALRGGRHACAGMGSARPLTALNRGGHHANAR